jgi:hypothetical protein
VSQNVETLSHHTKQHPLGRGAKKHESTKKAKAKAKKMNNEQ